MTTAVDIGRRAQLLAETQRDLVRAPHAAPRSFDASLITKALDQAEKRLLSASRDSVHAKAAEWFLDNSYLLHRAARQIADEFPIAFEARLPRLASGPAKDRARVDALARALVAESDIDLDESALVRFVLAYQDVSVLTIAELWALPTMLRASVLHGILHSLGELGVIARAPSHELSAFHLDPAAGIERGIRALRLFAEIDWKEFFEATSRVESVLREDPAGVYQRMDFVTCDSYRKAVEELAWGTRTAEEAVARAAIALAGAHLPESQGGHVGSYLVGRARAVLEGQIGYRTAGWERVRRIVLAWPTATFFGMLTAAMVPFLVLVTGYALVVGAGPRGVVVAFLLGLLPATLVATTWVRASLATLLSPSRLPKLDFVDGIPADARTLVVIPALLGKPSDVQSLVRRLELHFFANRDPNVSFALLTDLLDSTSATSDEHLVALATRSIAALNDEHGMGTERPFHLLHRERRWNAAENKFMGWERKRGKLEELNRLLRGDEKTSYRVHEGEPAGLLGIRYVLTADSDTELPMGTAKRLVGLLAHPLNQAVQGASGRVSAGYTIAQPRIEISPSSARASRFARLFAGDIGFDIYTHAASDTYQDLFGAGIFVGKGLYDVDAFARSLEDRTPENSIASHDLFEGIHGRVALATDIVVFEEYPAHYASFSRRMHRWVRGDWQLLPWLLPWVPSGAGKWIRNQLSLVDRWKIADNLRRSLLAPGLIVFLLGGIGWLPGRPWVWALLALAAILSPILPTFVGDRRKVAEAMGRSTLGILFLATEASVVLDAAARALFRMTITRRNMLQWTAAAHTESAVQARSQRAFLWRELSASPFVATLATCLLIWTRPDALWVAAPFLVAWFVAPEVARWLSEPSTLRREVLDTKSRHSLRLLARRTWLFFEAFVGPADQWLPVDNHQEDPHKQTARRTSPTNIGMMLLSTLAAYDFGWISPTELSLRLSNSFDTIAKLPRYQGHLLNWYDTRTLEPLLPRYVSTVDSGNLAGCLLALRQGCADVVQGQVLRDASWEGLSDALELFGQACIAAEPSGETGAVVARMHLGVRTAREHPEQAYRVLQTSFEELEPELDRALFAMLARGIVRHEPDALEALRTWMGRIHHQLTEMRRELSSLLPWLAWPEDAVVRALDLPSMLTVASIPAECARYTSALDEWERAQSPPSEGNLRSIQRVREALRASSEHARSVLNRLGNVALRAQSEVDGMGFGFLYDEHAKLFRIGLNVTLDRLDDNHYDLLASESRLASYLAVVRGEVPRSHWNALGRPMTRAEGHAVLVSWGGTMFEYLMPSLLMRSQRGTLLAESCEAAVSVQMAWCRAKGAPWGVSESAYARRDAHETYQYRSFGVPGLGFKRGMEEDLVIAPYASVLAVSLRPKAVAENVSVLTAQGMMGAYGLFEAMDFHPVEAPVDRKSAVVRSYMAHHQGMLLIALDNALQGSPMVARFHADPEVQSGEALLNERNPISPELDRPLVASPTTDDPEAMGSLPLLPTWTVVENVYPQAHVLGNGKMTSILTDAGGGGLRWRGIALTSWKPDPIDTGDGLWIYLHDKDTGRVSLATSSAGRTSYGAHEAQYLRRDDGLTVHVDVTVAAADDVEIRLLTLRNESDRPRKLDVVSAAEPVLLPIAAAGRHPAFAKLFLEREVVPGIDGVLFARRAQSAEEESAVIVHRLVREGHHVTFGGSIADRETLYGRCGDIRTPRLGQPTQSLQSSQSLQSPQSEALGLDPLLSITASIELAPQGSATFAFVTTVARSRKEALEIARRYGSIHTVRWAFHDAELHAARRVRRALVSPEDLPAVQGLFSSLLFPNAALRAPSEVLTLAKPTQHGLWGRGISGDDPILLVHVRDPSSALLTEVIAAQTYLRTCGVRVDLVLLDDQATGYLSEASGTLGALLTRLGATDRVNRRGGIYVVSRDQLHDDERRSLEAAARVVVDTNDGTLRARLSKQIARIAELPPFEPTRNLDTQVGVPPCPPLLFDNGIGGFTEDGREYVIRVRPGSPLPAPWCNVLANAEMGCLVSESSLGCTWSGNSGENRLTPWRNDPIFDTPSEALYLRDEETAALWSPTPLPAGGDAETLVRHGAGYTTYLRESQGLEQELCVFVPPGSCLKVVRLRLRNTLPRHRRLTATYYAEWVLGSAREAQSPYVVPAFDRGHSCLLATASFFGDRGDRTAFLASSRDVHSFTCDRNELLGKRGDLAHPAALARWGLSDRVEAGLDPCAALQVHLELEPGGTVETCFFLGEAPDREAALQAIADARAPGKTALAWTALTAHWDHLLGAVRVSTPDLAMDLMLNRWLLYQALSARFFGRTGYYQSSGAFGFRDQLQDVLAFLHAAPELTRAHLLESAKHQFEAGDVLHWWHPPVGRGVRTRCSDDMLWLPYVLAEYVRATGDLTILEEVVPFLQADPLRDDEHDRYAEFAVSSTPGTLFEHARRALVRAVTAGAHGLPLMGDGDWNDGMNKVGAQGRGESVWLAWFATSCMTRFATLCERTHREEDGKVWRAKAEALRRTVEEVAWDGDWYLRAFHDDGSKLGSSGALECRIDSIAQTWAVLSGAGEETRCARALESVERLLVREQDRLVLLLAPPFDSALHDPGYIRAYPPGVRENGGQYTHAATWLGHAYVLRREGAPALRIFDMLNPVHHGRSAAEVARYGVEPYVLAGDVYGAAPRTGRGGWSWYTGAAAWLWRLGVDGILGLTLEEGELRVNPCIPAGWKGFEAWVRVGDRTRHVVVENGRSEEKISPTITVDGAPVSRATDQRDLPLR